MIPRAPARRLLRELSAPRPRLSVRSFTTPPPQQPPLQSEIARQSSSQSAAAASAALQNLSHLTPAQITALLSNPPPPAPPNAHAHFRQHPPPPQQPSASPRRRLLTRALWALAFFSVGFKLTSDQIATFRFSAPFLYSPLNCQDPEEKRFYREEATRHAVREHPTLAAMVPSVSVSADGKPASVRHSDWDHWEPYSDFSPWQKRQHLCAGSLDNPDGLGLVHLVFRHRLTGELVLAVVFGQGTSGWPSVVHGGMLSTIMDEAMGRLAALNFDANTAVTAKLAMEFKEPATPGDVYLVRVNKVLPELQKDSPDAEDKTNRKLWIVGRMEGPEGEVVCEAKGLFVVPKSGDVKPLGKKF
ncbi:Uncharacterized protein C8034_v010783 [Colletotrichum sidae]|uniref:Thioesterase domain-containing protein n=1 Tax=Colletotrichum sidae TaxID=1347389 RepID=A0A4R8TIC5_9PEZI|nr:Uncharacterized protein C8034_v010783 [Colletotrichum sidae]